MNTNDPSRDLAKAFPARADDLRRLRQRLITAAQSDGILDVAYRTLDT